MKILMIGNVRNTRTGGAARIMHFLREELNSQGHQMDLVFADDVPDPFDWCGLTSVTFPFLMFMKIGQLAQQNGPYDILDIHTLGGAVYAFLRKSVRHLPKCVVRSYGADELRWELEKEEDRLGLRRLGLKSRFFYYNFIIRQARYATRWADHVITAAHSEKEFYVKVYRRTHDSVTFIPHGVGKEFFLQRDYIRAPIRLLYFGGWEWRKGTRYLVEAFTRVARMRDDITLSLVGTGEEEGIVKQAFPLDLHNRVRVIPRVASECVPGVYAEHDIFVFPSLFEGMPLVVPEAMASGMPVVTTRACGMQDIIEDGVTGLLVPTRDADALVKQITTLLNNPVLCQGLGRAAQQKARELTWDIIARQTLQTYERLLYGSIP